MKHEAGAACFSHSVPRGNTAAESYAGLRSAVTPTHAELSEKNKWRQ